jgi:hypothetical protein
MFEDLRQQASEGSLEEQEEEDVYAFRDRPRRRDFLGMTPGQRLVLSLMLLMMVCIMGSLILLVTEKVVPPFL